MLMPYCCCMDHDRFPLLLCFAHGRVWIWESFPSIDCHCCWLAQFPVLLWGCLCTMLFCECLFLHWSLCTVLLLSPTPSRQAVAGQPKRTSERSGKQNLRLCNHFSILPWLWICDWSHHFTQQALLQHFKSCCVQLHKEVVCACCSLLHSVSFMLWEFLQCSAGAQEKMKSTPWIQDTIIDMQKTGCLLQLRTKKCWLILTAINLRSSSSSHLSLWHVLLHGRHMFFKILLGKEQ